MDGLLSTLSEPELALIRETEPDRMGELDEDGLVELHARIRRARNKYVKIYRRRAAARVPEKGGRGFARPKNARARGKAEVFEDALSRVSERLAVVARAGAEALREERLSAASSGRSMGPGPLAADGSPGGSQAQVGTPRGSARKKRSAASAAQGERSPAARDSR